MNWHLLPKSKALWTTLTMIMIKILMVMNFHLFPRPPELPGSRGGLTRVHSPSNNNFRPSCDKNDVSEMKK